nr:DUF687 family protein [Chlamydia buteonis]
MTDCLLDFKGFFLLNELNVRKHATNAISASIHTVYDDCSASRPDHSEENQEFNESQTGILEISQPTIDVTLTNNLSFVGSLEGTPSVSEDVHEDSVLPPESFLDRLGEAVMNILRISEAVSIFWIFPFKPSVVFFGIDGVCICFLMLTSPRSRRERYRNVRILLLCYHTFSPACTAALYRVITFFGWTLLGRDVLEYALPELRDALCRRCLRWFGSITEDHRHLFSRVTRIGRANINSCYRRDGHFWA